MLGRRVGDDLRLDRAAELVHTKMATVRCAQHVQVQNAAERAKEPEDGEQVEWIAKPVESPVLHLRKTSTAVIVLVEISAEIE